MHMYNYVSVRLKKKGTAKILGFGIRDRIKFFIGFGARVRYKDFEIQGLLGERTILVHFPTNGMPDIPSKVTDSVSYEKLEFRPKYSNGIGHFGKTSILTTTLDGNQNLIIHGPTTTEVSSSIKRFENGELPPDWEKTMPQHSPRPPLRVEIWRANG